MAGLERLEDHRFIERVIGTRPGDHICVLYDDTPEERLTEVAAFFRDALALGERCIYVSDDLDPTNVRSSLRGRGLNVDAEEARGAISIWSRREWREPGPLDTIRKAAQVRELMEQTFILGFTGVRFAVEMTWTMIPDVPDEDLQAWESVSNDLLAQAPIRAMCLYSRSSMRPETVQVGLETHPLLLDEYGLRRNGEYQA